MLAESAELTAPEVCSPDPGNLGVLARLRQLPRYASAALVRPGDSFPP